MNAMKEGDRIHFFGLWDKHFQESIRLSEPSYQKLEFLMSLYFAIFPIHEHVNKSFNMTLSYTMDQFKQFLETRGAALCKSTQFLCYYALPYVPDPRTHASFADLFTSHWVIDLESRLKNFLSKALNEKGLPRLVQLLNQTVCFSFKKNFKFFLIKINVLGNTRNQRINTTTFIRN